MTYRTIEKVPFDLLLGQTAVANFEPELAGPCRLNCNFSATPIRRGAKEHALLLRYMSRETAESHDSHAVTESTSESATALPIARVLAARRYR